MEDWLQRPIDAVTLGLAVMVVVLLISIIIVGNKLKRLRKSYVQFMGQSGVGNLEQVVIDLKDQISQQQQRLQQLTAVVEQMGQTIRRKKGNLAIHRYNAFGERGSDLSFSLAVINDDEDGLVLSGIHGREQTFVYAKPIAQGQSEYTLTPEEKQAINLASQSAQKA